MTNVTVQEALNIKYQDARDRLKDNPDGWDDFDMFKAGYEAALSEIGKCEPVAYIEPDSVGFGILKFKDNHTYRFSPTSINHIKVWLYDKPQPREWVGLSDEDKKLLSHKVYANDHSINGTITLVEAKCKQLNTKG